MVETGWLWVVFTLLAAAGQTARNAMQRELMAALGRDAAAIPGCQVRIVRGHFIPPSPRRPDRLEALSYLGCGFVATKRGGAHGYEINR